MLSTSINLPMEEEVVAAPQKITKKRRPEKLWTVSPDLLFAHTINPGSIATYAYNNGHFTVDYNNERTMSKLMECLLFYPKEFDSVFNIEVRPPYDWQTHHFADELTKRINKELEETGEISESQIESLKNEIYKTHTYTHPIGTILTELEENDAYLVSKMNVGKINVTEKQVHLAEKAVSRIPNKPNLASPHNGACQNEALNKQWKDLNSDVYLNLVCSVPLLFNGDINFLFYSAFTETNIANTQIKLDTLSQSYIKYDIGLALIILGSKNADIKVMVADCWGNVIKVQLTPGTVATIIKQTETALTELTQSLKNPANWQRKYNVNRNSEFILI